MAGSLEEGSGGDYRKEGYYGTFQSGVPQPVPPSQSPHYPSATGLCIFSFDPFFFGLPNLQTTKASNQECTLRFYPHAENLRPIHGMHFVSLKN